LSSILDSLKKLEKETSQQNNLLVHAWTDRKAGIPKRVIGIVGGICICVGAIGLAAYYGGEANTIPEPLSTVAAPAPKPAAILDKPEKPLTPSPDAPAPLPSTSTNRNAITSAATSEIKASDSESIAKPISSESENTKQVVKIDTEQAVASEKPPKEAQKEEKAPAEPERQVVTAEKDTSDSQDVISQNVPVKKEEPLPVDRLEGVGIKIQAISWSEAPEQSLAVINNQVLREGDGIEGYQISRINPDDIILQRGGKVFQLDFRSTGMH